MRPPREAIVRRDGCLLVLLVLVLVPFLAYGQDPSLASSGTQAVSLGDLGSISWPAAISWLAYLLRQWEPRIHVTHRNEG